MKHKKKKNSPTIVVDSKRPEYKKYELLKEKLRYQQALRENSKKIDHKQVRLNIQAGALPTPTYYIMTALAAVIAAYGLLSNSSAVIIGAMLITMMLGPVAGISLALIDSRWMMFRTSLQTLGLGLLLMFGIGIVLGLFHYNLPLSKEILARTQPNLMDLMIALAAGAAGAFACVSPRLSIPVVETAVANAIIPPIVASAILLAHLQWQLAMSALLLAFTNMLAIQISASLVLWVSGFRRGSGEELSNGFVTFVKRNAIGLLCLVALGIYLSINFATSVHQQVYNYQTETNIRKVLEQKDNVISTIQYNGRSNFTLIRVVVMGNHQPSEYDIQALEASLPKDLLQHPSKIQVRFIPVTIVQTGVYNNQIQPEEVGGLIH